MSGYPDSRTERRREDRTTGVKSRCKAAVDTFLDVEQAKYCRPELKVIEDVDRAIEAGSTADAQIAVRSIIQGSVDWRLENLGWHLENRINRVALYGWLDMLLGIDDEMPMTPWGRGIPLREAINKLMYDNILTEANQSPIGVNGRVMIQTILERSFDRERPFVADAGRQTDESGSTPPILWLIQSQDSQALSLLETCSRPITDYPRIAADAMYRVLDSGNTRLFDALIDRGISPGDANPEIGDGVDWITIYRETDPENPILEKLIRYYESQPGNEDRQQTSTIELERPKVGHRPF